MQHPLDHEHYVEKQVRPVAEPVLAALGLDFDRVIGDDRQMDLYARPGLGLKRLTALNALRDGNTGTAPDRSKHPIPRIRLIRWTSRRRPHILLHAHCDTAVIP